MNLTSEEIAAAFEGQDGQSRAGLCLVGAVIQEYPVLEDKIMDNARYSAPTIVRVLKNLGLPPLSASTVNNHRKGTCRCPKETP